eukprot:jgi/Galph1/2173/GphlegSOOS_G837.1
MTSSSTKEVWFTALNGTLKILILTGVGFYLAYRGKLKKEISKNISNIIFQVLLPCLLFSSILRTLVNIGLLPLWYIPMLAGSFLMLGWGVGLLVCKITKPPAFFRRACIVACALGNSNQLPILIMDTLCGFYPSFQELGASCRELATGYISLFLLVFSTVSWTWFYRYLEGSPRVEDMSNNSNNAVLYSVVEDDENNNNNNNRELLPIKNARMAHTEDQNLPSTHTTMIHEYHSSEMKETQFNKVQGVSSENKHTSSFWETPSTSGENSGILLSNMNQNDSCERDQSRFWMIMMSTISSCRRLATPPSIAIFSALLLGTLFKPIALLLVGANAPLRVIIAAQETLGAAAIALMSLVVGANLYTSYQRGFRNIGVSYSCIFGIALCRLLIMPVLGWLFISLLYWLGLFGYRVDNIELLVMLIESSVPSANNVVIMCEMVGTSEEPISVALFWQFMMAPVFLTANMAFFLWSLP